LGLAIVICLLGLAVLAAWGLFWLGFGLHFAPASLLLSTIPWILLLLIAAIGLCLGMLCVEMLRRRPSQFVGG
jgi:biotin transporter BioY